MTNDSNFLDISCNGPARSLSNLSNLERNCNQIFVKGPAITKDFFDKIQNDVVPQKTDLFGYQMNTRRLILLTGLILLFTFSTMGTFAMWFTNSYQNKINSMMVISEDSPVYDLWKAPPAKAYVNIFIFNYTNVDDFESGRAKKLHVEELGPYVYSEQLERVNIRFNKVDGTVSYQEKRTYVFNEELSNGSKYDMVTVPNFPLLSASHIAKHQFNFLARMSMSGLFKSLSQKAFKTVEAHKLITGYDDPLYNLAKNYLIFTDKRTFERFGILVWKDGLQPDVLTINTGAHNFSRIGRIESYSGKSNVNMWTSDSCNNLQASDGLIYPPAQVKNKENLTFFVPQMCRKLDLLFDKETTMLDKVPVNRYKLPMDMFDSSMDDKCYCNKQNGVCPPKGVFNSTLCSFDAPVFYSWPYFYNADPALKKAISGLDKTPTLDDTFLDIHAKAGVLLRGKIKVQLNVQLVRSFGITQLVAYPSELMLPMVWIETGLEEKDLPASIVSIIYQATFTVRNIELGLKYGCLLATMVTLTGILLVLKRRRQSRLRMDSLRRPIEFEH